MATGEGCTGIATAYSLDLLLGGADGDPAYLQLGSAGGREMG